MCICTQKLEEKYNYLHKREQDFTANITDAPIFPKIRNTIKSAREMMVHISIIITHFKTSHVLKKLLSSSSKTSRYWTFLLWNFHNKTPHSKIIRTNRSIGWYISYASSSRVLVAFGSQVNTFFHLMATPANFLNNLLRISVMISQYSHQSPWHFRKSNTKNVGVSNFISKNL